MASTEDDRGSSDYLVGDEIVRLTKEDFLRLIPTRPPELEWKLTAREATITLRGKSRGIFPTVGAKKAVFDQVGAFVLRASDGKRTIQEIGKLLAEAYNLKQDQAELSLVQFLMGLHRRGYVRLKKPAGLTLQAIPVWVMSALGFTLIPVGIVEEQGECSKVQVYPNFAAGLKGLEAFSHVIVLYWLHGRDNPEDRTVVEVIPKKQLGATVGVFASRSPARPNPIGFSVAEILEIEGSVLTLRGLDAMKGSPVLDLKPYLPRDDAVADARVPEWALREPKT